MRCNAVLQAGGSGRKLGGGEWLPAPTPLECAALYTILAVGTVLIGGWLWGRYVEEDEEQVAFSVVLDEETLAEGRVEERPLDEVADSQ